MKCRHCGAGLSLPLIDLGSAPPSNAYLDAQSLRAPEKWYPLRVLVCTQCWLAQTEEWSGSVELFPDDYAYFSSYSTTWLKHAEHYVQDVCDRFKLSSESFVVEVAANDGYLLQYVQERGIPCLGIEPTAGTAAAGRSKGLDIIEDFFSSRLAHDLVREGKQADLVVANNVLAHVPDINDFVSGFSLLLKSSGTATFEFPHLLKLMEQNQFDTVYHEHYSYLSLTAVQTIFKANSLAIFDVEEVSTHGGSLRVFAERRDTASRSQSSAVVNLLTRERRAGICDNVFYGDFQKRAIGVKNDLLEFLIRSAREGKKIAAYGAAAKGNTLLNYAGIRSDLLPYVVDKNPAKQDKYLPGSRIPIVRETHLRTHRPDFVLILPWNLRDEIFKQLDYIRSWGGQFVTAVPTLAVV